VDLQCLINGLEIEVSDAFLHQCNAPSPVGESQSQLPRVNLRYSPNEPRNVAENCSLVRITSVHVESAQSVVIKTADSYAKLKLT
jgi:hypothetical protein